MSEQAKAAGTGRESIDLEQILHWVLLIGVTVSIGVMLVGLLLLALHPAQTAHQTTPIRQAFVLALKGDPGAVLTVGIILLMATPAIRVVTCLIGFLAERDWLYGGVALLVAMVLAFSIFVAA
ncbi:MAG TPA: DUF1634 domain-containing protein [Bacillota bacterium]